MMESVLVANRGEIAVRIMSTLRRLGIRTIAVYSDADAGAPHVRAADQAVRIGPPAARESYLRVDRIVEAALATGASAIHPGYGFLSENPELARACAAAGITFIGPSAEVIAAMGDKAEAKRLAVAAGVPIVPGTDDADLDDAALADAIAAIGFPVLLKPVAGGGGKGMRIVRATDEIAEQIASARREARGAFGDDRIIVERLVERPRHVEVQVLADRHGAVVHLGDRECSLQRRHQKVVEEAPAPRLDPEVRARMAEASVRLAREVGYESAGTVEFIVPADNPADFAFLEMNTRLQVEHPVTEMVTGLDLVELQVRIAAGEPLPLAQSDITMNGHSIEVRVYAEDPQRGFLPAAGTVLAWQPDAGLRVDAAVEPGQVVTTDYDPMLAKAIAWAPAREEAVQRLIEGLSRTVLLGVTSNIDVLGRVLAEDRVRAGDLDTGLLAEILERVLEADAGLPPECAEAAARHALAAAGAAAGGPWAARDGWRLTGSEPIVLDVTGAEPGAVPVEVRIDPARPAGEASTTVMSDAEGRWWLHAPAWGSRCVTVTPPRTRVIRAVGGAGGGVQAAWVARSPLPGSIVDLPLAVGDEVAEGDVVVVVEAMKMEHAMRAPGPGRIARLHVGVGDQVTLDAALVTIDPPVEASAEGES